MPNIPNKKTAACNRTTQSNQEIVFLIKEPSKNDASSNHLVPAIIPVLFFQKVIILFLHFSQDFVITGISKCFF